MGALRQTFSLIYSDYRRYQATGRGQSRPLAILLLVQGFWASAVYRLAHAADRSLHVPGLRGVVRVFFMFIQKGVEVLTGICLPPETEIGPGLYIGHFGRIIVSSRARIGANCNLSHGVTLGLTHRGGESGAPVIGDRVYIGPQAIIIGNVAIGDDAAIGAGAVVTRSVPERGVVAGNPARLISAKGSFDFVHYDGMEEDTERRASREQMEQRQPEGLLRLVNTGGSREP